MEIKYQNLKIKRSHKTIIQNLNLNIKDGDLCVLVGPSGSGKSTILEATAGLVSTEGGSIHFNDVDITNAKPDSRQIGYVFQDFALYPNMTVYQNIEFGLKVKKIAKDTRNKLIEDILNTVDLQAHAKSYPYQLSGGQKQRVAIARALVLKPEVLLMDEPLSSLDPNLRQKLRAQIVQIQKQFGKTMIFVTHDQSEALAMADHIVVLNDGQIIESGSPFEIYNNPTSEFSLKFWSGEYLNEISNQDFISDYIHNQYSKVFIRPANITLKTGSTWTVTNISLHGETQTVTLENEMKLYVSTPSSQPINIFDCFDIQIDKYFTF